VSPTCRDSWFRVRGAMNTLPVILPEIGDSLTKLGRWMVVIYNNDYNSMDEVIAILMHATGCDLQEAMIETWEANAFGKASVHFASKSECGRVAQIIAGIGVRTEVCPEWED
jgi:ATP-dependent Clp protease adapter protein ClpS